MRRAAVLGSLLVLALTGCGSSGPGGYTQTKLDQTATQCGIELSVHGVDPYDAAAYDAAFVTCAQHKLPKLSRDDALTLAHKENGAFG